MSAVIQRTVVDGIDHFVTQWGAKVQCDECHDEYGVGMRWLPPDSRARLANDLREAGWVVEGDHERHVCPDCVGAFGTPTEKP
jgi:Zn finger protein HypA/HybF involved in hydrogenase expression